MHCATAASGSGGNRLVNSWAVDRLSMSQRAELSYVHARLWQLAHPERAIRSHVSGKPTAFFRAA
jgi:hypothetical protein